MGKHVSDCYFILCFVHNSRYAGAIGTWSPGHCDADGTAAWNFNFGPGVKLWFFVSRKGIEQLAKLGNVL